MELLKISAGRLNSIPAVYQATVHKLSEFNDAWRKGNLPSIEWDLTEIRTGQINVAAASFFLAIAHRIRQYTGRSQSVRVEWHPKTFSFLEDINFFRVADEYDLFDWPYEIGGYEDGLINPNTKILAYEKLSERPNLENRSDLSNWKKVHREYYRKNIIDKCEALFTSSDEFGRNSNYPLVISRTCAEIAVNSLLWGESAAFIGLQRTRNMIFISVCDIGLGFKSSFIKKNEHVSFLKETELDPDIVSLALGAVVNQNDFGIKRAISTIIELGGNISLSSGKGEIHWGRELWTRYLNGTENHGVYQGINELPKPVFKTDRDLKYNGYCRKWKDSIRGTRISFSIPLGGHK